MSAAAPERPPRLNPFAFPADTTFRFALLAVAVLGANLYVWQWISTATRSFSDDRAASLACLRLSPAGASTTEEFAAASGAFSRCVAELYRYQVWWMLGGTALLLVVTAALVALAPWWVRRRRRLVPFVEADAPAFVTEVHALAAEQGVRPPTLYWNPLDGSAAGIAFGRPGSHALGFGGGLVVQSATDPTTFRAVVRHELAHIRNRDVGITYVTLALWVAFLVVSVVPFLATVLDEGRATIWSLSWRLAALAALVYATRNSVLRARELYADVRASLYDPPGGGLRRLLAERRARPRTLAARLRSVHPEPAARLAVLDDTRSLFPLGAAVAFAAGLTTTIAFEGVVQLLSSFVADALDLRFLAALAFVPLSVGVVGVGIWRESFAALAHGRSPDPLWRDALAFTGGLVLGPELALARPVVAQETLLAGVRTTGGVLWLAALVAVIVLLFAWIRTAAWWWLAALGGRRPGAALAAGLGTAAAGVTALLGVYYGARSVGESLAFSRAATGFQHAAVDAEVWAVPRQAWQFVMDGLLLVIVQKPYVVPVLALLATFPLAAGLVRRRSEEAPWAFLDPGARLTAPPPARPLRPLLVGAVAGVAFLGLAALIRLTVHYGVDAATRATDAAILSIFVFTIAVALIVQLAAGAVAAWTHGLAGALGAAFVAGCFGWLGIVAGPAVGGCLDPLSINPGPCAWTVEATFAVDVFQLVIAEGAIAGAVGGAAAIAAHALAARRRSEELHPAGAAS